MSDAVTVAIIASLPPTLVAMAALWKVGKIENVVHVVHKEINSRFSEWKEDMKQAAVASNIASKAEGVKEERERGKS
jgi:gas vesicle protein